MINESLLGKHQRSIIGVFFNSPNVSFSLRELARRAKMDPGNTKRCVEKLIQKGLLMKEKSKNQVLIGPKYTHPITRKLFEAFEIRRTLSFLDQDEKLEEEMLFLVELLSGLDSLLMLSLYGIKRDSKALLDKQLPLLIVKIVSEPKLQIQKAINGLCKDYGFCYMLEPKILNAAEFEDSVKDIPGFFSDFWSNRIVLHGESYLWRTIIRLGLLERE